MNEPARPPPAAPHVGLAYAVAKTDPVTCANERIGWSVVHGITNDASCGWAGWEGFVPTLLLGRPGWA